jgi:hypothetical protein
MKIWGHWMDKYDALVYKGLFAPYVLTVYTAQRKYTLIPWSQKRMEPLVGFNTYINTLSITILFEPCICGVQ